MYRVLRLFPGWTVGDYEAAPASFCDRAIQFDLIEQAAEAKRRQRGE